MLKTGTSLIALDLSDNLDDAAEDGPGFVSEIATGLEANRSLSKLDLSGNNIGGQPMQHGWVSSVCAMTALGASLVACGTVTDLSISNNNLNPEDIPGFAEHLKDMGSLSKLTWSGEQWVNKETGELEDAPPVTLDTTMTEADFSNKHLGACGAMILAAFISSKSMKDKGSLSELDLSKNNLRSEGLSAVSEALKSTSIKQLNIAENRRASNQGRKDMSGVIKFAEDMKDMGSLSKFTFSGDSSNLPGDESKPVTVEVGMTEADFSGAKLRTSGAIILAAWLEHKVHHTTQTDYC
jgi:hypothetical protein